MTSTPGERDDRLALRLILAGSRFARRAGRIPGTTHSATTWQALGELDLHGPMRVSELTRRQHVAQPTMTAIMHRLETDGWVTRDPDPDDGRASLVSLTDPGRSALEEYRLEAAARATPLLARLEEGDRALLSRAADLLEQLAASADPAPR